MNRVCQAPCLTYLTPCVTPLSNLTNLCLNQVCHAPSAAGTAAHTSGPVAVVASPHAPLETFLRAAGAVLLTHEELEAFRAAWGSEGEASERRGGSEGDATGRGREQGGSGPGGALRAGRLFADQWRDICALLYPSPQSTTPFSAPAPSASPLHHPPAPLPALVDGVVATPAWLAARALLNDLGTVERTLCQRHRQHQHRATMEAWAEARVEVAEGITQGGSGASKVGEGEGEVRGGGGTSAAGQAAGGGAPGGARPRGGGEEYMEAQDRMVAQRFLKSYA